MHMIVAWWSEGPVKAAAFVDTPAGMTGEGEPVPVPVAPSATAHSG